MARVGTRIAAGVRNGLLRPGRPKRTVTGVHDGTAQDARAAVDRDDLPFSW